MDTVIFVSINNSYFGFDTNISTRNLAASRRLAASTRCQAVPGVTQQMQ